MGLDYILDVQTKLEQPQALRLIADKIGVEPTDNTDVDTPILSIFVTKADENHREIIKNDFGFMPTLTVDFRLSPENDEDARNGRRDIIRAVMSILRNSDGDAVFQFNYDYPLLERSNGRLMLNSDWKEWISYSMLKEVDVPYEFITGMQHRRVPTA